MNVCWCCWFNSNKKTYTNMVDNSNFLLSKTIPAENQITGKGSMATWWAGECKHFEVFHSNNNNNNKNNENFSHLCRRETGITKDSPISAVKSSDKPSDDGVYEYDSFFEYDIFTRLDGWQEARRKRRKGRRALEAEGKEIFSNMQDAFERTNDGSFKTKDFKDCDERVFIPDLIAKETKQESAKDNVGNMSSTNDTSFKASNQILQNSLTKPRILAVHPKRNFKDSLSRDGIQSGHYKKEKESSVNSNENNFSYGHYSPLIYFKPKKENDKTEVEKETVINSKSISQVTPIRKSHLSGEEESFSSVSSSSSPVPLSDNKESGETQKVTPFDQLPQESDDYVDTYEVIQLHMIHIHVIQFYNSFFYLFVGKRRGEGILYTITNTLEEKEHNNNKC